MRYRPKNIAALHVALAGFPDTVRVELEPDVQMSAKTVGELRKMTSWPENYVIATPMERHPGETVKIGKATMATRVSPKT